MIVSFNEMHRFFYAFKAVLSAMCRMQHPLQMKGRWESMQYKCHVCFPIMNSQKWNCYFQNRIIMSCLPIPTLIYLWEIYIFPGFVGLFCYREICGQILGTNKSLTDTWMWKLGLRPRNSQKRNTQMGCSLQCHSWSLPCEAVLFMCLFSYVLLV